MAKHWTCHEHLSKRTRRRCPSLSPPAAAARRHFSIASFSAIERAWNDSPSYCHWSPSRCHWIHWRLLSCDNSSATCVATLAGHSRSVCSVVFHPTAPLLATGSGDNTVRLWLLSCDNSSATCVATLEGHSGSGYSVAFHPTAPLLATTGDGNCTVKLWR